MKKYIGSTMSLILGILYFLSALIKPNSGLIAGPVMILGALAYMSAKSRRLKSKPSTFKHVLEIAAICIIIAMCLLQKNLSHLITTDPVPNLIIPLWAIIAYLTIAIKKKEGE
jgi:hypothetical protein